MREQGKKGKVKSLKCSWRSENKLKVKMQRPNKRSHKGTEQR